MNFRSMLRNGAIVVGLVYLALCIAACGPKGASDQALATDIQAKLYADPNARTANVKVNVASGVVTLTGDAPNPDVALQVVNIANGTSGVKGVNNQLKVASPTTATAETPNAYPPPMVSPSPVPNAPMAQNAPPPPAERGEHRDADGRSNTARHEEAHRGEPRPVSWTVPAGTDLHVQMIDSISSKTNSAGQTFRASLADPIVVGDNTVLPAGSDATVLLEAAKGAGRIRGQADLQVRLVRVAHDGRAFDVDTSVHDEVGKARGRQTAVRTGIGAAAGAVIGALAGGGKGAAIGSLAGGGAGAGFQFATHGQQVSIPSESRLTFRLEAPLVVTTAP